MLLLRDKKFTKADYEHCGIFVGVHHDEDGNPLVVADGVCIGPVDDVFDLLVRYRDQSRPMSDRVAALEARIDALIRSIPAQVIQGVHRAQRANALR